MYLVWSHHLANSTAAIMTLFAISNYHWPICWMISFILIVRLLFPYWLWWQVILYTWFWLRVHGGCDWSAEDAYSTAAPDPTFAFVEGLCCPALEFLFAFWIMITYYTMLTSLFCMQKHLHEKNNPLAVAFNSTFRYIDDDWSIYNDQFHSYVDSLCLSELEIKTTRESSTSVSYLDVLLNIDAGGKLKTQLYDKREDFNFAIVNFPHT
jgi:hypothetical protein